MTAAKPYRELTPAALIGGILVGALLNMGIVYAGLQIGFTIVGSTVAAVIGFGVLRGLLGKGSILEVNIFQTVASSVNTVNAGIIFTVPVLFLLGFEQDINYSALMLAAIAGSLLGVVMIIPLRKQIIEYERLRFPEGVAVATILKSPGAGMEKARLLIAGVAISGSVAVGTHSELLPDYFNLGQVLGLPGAFTLIFAVSLLSLGAGYLAGRGGLVVLYGTILNYWVLVPIAVLLGWVPESFGGINFLDFVHDDYKPAADAVLAEGETLPAGLAYASNFLGEFATFTSRHVGIGMILGGAIAGILLAAPALKSALASLRSGGQTGRREEVPISVLNGGLALGMIMLVIATKLAGGEHLGWGKVFAVAVAGGVWLWLAGLVVAQTTGRTDWSPLSGLALIAIAIMMGIMGTDSVYVVPAVTVGASICVATSMCADMMADLKTGYLVGSRPLRQQVAQIMTCWIGPAIALMTVIVLWKAYGFGPEQAKVLHDRAIEAGGAALEEFHAAGGSDTELPEGIPELGAPQAGALQSAIEIVQDGDVPVGKYAGGAILGIVVSFLVSPGLGVMVGLSMYLPFKYMIVFGIGGILNILISRRKGVRWAEDKGVPLAAGLIVGDALVGVLFAIFEVATSMSA